MFENFPSEKKHSLNGFDYVPLKPKTEVKIVRTNIFIAWRCDHLPH